MSKKKEIIEFDEGSFAGTLAYGYSNKKEAFKALTEATGGATEYDNLEKIRVRRFKKIDGEEYFDWSEECQHCGRSDKKGVWSYSDFG